MRSTIKMNLFVFQLYTKSKTDMGSHSMILNKGNKITYSKFEAFHILGKYKEQRKKKFRNEISKHMTTT